MSKRWIIAKWKESGAYVASDSVNGKIYKNRGTAENVCEAKYPLQAVVRTVDV